MTDRRIVETFYGPLSVANLATSAIGAGSGSLGFSLSNVNHGYTLSGTESTAANIAVVLANVIKALKQRGILDATGTGV